MTDQISSNELFSNIRKTAEMYVSKGEFARVLPEHIFGLLDEIERLRLDVDYYYALASGRAALDPRPVASKDQLQREVVARWLYAFAHPEDDGNDWRDYETSAADLLSKLVPDNEPQPAASNYQLSDGSTVDPMIKLRRFLVHLSSPQCAPFFHDDGFPRSVLAKDAAEFVKVLDANAKERAEDLDRMERAAETIEQLTAASTALEPSAERTPADYAIEHAEYMALTAEQFVEAFNKLSVGGTPWPAIESACELSRGLSERVYEFRKRADRYTAARHAQPPSAGINCGNCATPDYCNQIRGLCTHAPIPALTKCVVHAPALDDNGKQYCTRCDSTLGEGV